MTGQIIELGQTMLIRPGTFHNRRGPGLPSPAPKPCIVRRIMPGDKLAQVDCVDHYGNRVENYFIYVEITDLDFLPTR